MIAILVESVLAVFAYLLSGMRIQGAAYFVCGDDRD
jgi:hypothetical protein